MLFSMCNLDSWIICSKAALLIHYQIKLHVLFRFEKQEKPFICDYFLYPLQAIHKCIHFKTYHYISNSLYSGDCSLSPDLVSFCPKDTGRMKIPSVKIEFAGGQFY